MSVKQPGIKSIPRSVSMDDLRTDSIEFLRRFPGKFQRGATENEGVRVGPLPRNEADVEPMNLTEFPNEI